MAVAHGRYIGEVFFLAKDHECSWSLQLFFEKKKCILMIILVNFGEFKFFPHFLLRGKPTYSCNT